MELFYANLIVFLQYRYNYILVKFMRKKKLDVGYVEVRMLLYSGGMHRIPQVS